MSSGTAPGNVCQMGTVESFARTVRARRHELGISQSQLAESSGLHHTYISLLERSKRDPRFDTIIKLARGLDMTPAELLDRADRRAE